MAQIFFPKEVRDGEKRVAAIPETLKKFVKAGYQVTVETGAGLQAGLDDQHFKEAGAEIANDAKAAYAAADIVIKVQAPCEHPSGEHEVDLMKEGAILVCSLVPQSELATIKKLMARKISCFSTNLIPRTTIAQKMDTLSSQASIAGYKAVLLAGTHLGKYFPLLMTAAGTITPAKVIILGAGVAGLQAIATARRLGANVEAFDVRPAVKEQVESLGAKFIDIPLDENAEDAGGYAKEQSEDFLKRQRAELTRRLSSADVAITTALIPGRPAPVLITEEMVKVMPRGAVIVDLAVEQGGNCELSEPGQVVEKEGVTLVGLLNLPASVAIHASQLWARNMFNLVEHMTSEGNFNIDLEEEITDGALLTHEGKCRHEPTQQLLADGGA
jgi:NAD(P) transhydrogenase subunit alpha